jgi:serine/threonine-protein kinase HipA
MPSQLDVTLQERQVATITNVFGDMNVVAIDDAYRDDPDAPVLSVRAFRDPVTGRYRDAIRPTHTKLHPYFANLLPEGPLRKYLAEHAGVKAVRDFPLLWLLGGDLPGAFVLRDHDGQPMPPTDGDADVAASAPGHPMLRFSLAGVQLKFSAHGTPTRGLTISAGGLGGDIIVKLPDQRFTRVPENEFTMMSFARAVGIDAPVVDLVDPADVDGLPRDIRNVSGKAYAIRRFDRGPNGARIHTEDFAQINGLYPAQKYRHFNFDMLLEQVAIYVGVDAALDVVRRIVFTIGIGNGDMHAKNWSLIYPDGRTPRVSPAYDYVSTVVYMPNDDLGMNIAGTKLFTDVDDALLARLADHARLPRKPVVDAAREMVERMREVWPTMQEASPMTEDHRAIVMAHVDSLPLFAARSPLARR